MHGAIPQLPYLFLRYVFQARKQVYVTGSNSRALQEPGVNL